MKRSREREAFRMALVGASNSRQNKPASESCVKGEKEAEKKKQRKRETNRDKQKKY